MVIGIHGREATSLGALRGRGGGRRGEECVRDHPCRHTLLICPPPPPSPHLPPVTLCKCSCACSLPNHTAVASGDCPNKLSSGFMASSRGSNGWAWTPTTGPTPSRVGTCVCVRVCACTCVCVLCILIRMLSIKATTCWHRRHVHDPGRQIPDNHACADFNLKRKQMVANVVSTCTRVRVRVCRVRIRVRVCLKQTRYSQILIQLFQQF